MILGAECLPFHTGLHAERNEYAVMGVTSVSLEIDWFAANHPRERPASRHRGQGQ